MTTYCVLGKKLEVQEMPERLLQVWVSFRSQQGFPDRDRVSGPMSRQGFPVSRHGSQAACRCLVTT